MNKKEKLLSDLYISIEEMNIAYLNGDSLRIEFEKERQKTLRKLIEDVTNEH